MLSQLFRRMIFKVWERCLPKVFNLSLELKKRSPALQSSNNTGILIRFPSRSQLWGVLCSIPFIFRAAGIVSAAPPTPIPQPIADPLEIPVLPENPTQVDYGEASYYYNCMPCHGDQGQGLTDEFRAIWVEDHQNCWAVGCHGGRVSDEGFPIPRYIPPITSPITIQTHFPEAINLFTYLQATHPPQRPGVLTTEDYWALTSFVYYKNGLLPANEIIGIQTSKTIQMKPFIAGIIFLCLVMIVSTSLISQTRSNI